MPYLILLMSPPLLIVVPLKNQVFFLLYVSRPSVRPTALSSRKAQRNPSGLRSLAEFRETEAGLRRAA